MISSETSSKGVVDIAPTNPIPLEGGSENAFCTALNAVPLLLPTSDASSIPVNLLNVSGSSGPSKHCVVSSNGPIEDHDVVVAVMGSTGAGKSTFVNIAAGREVVAVGYNLRSQTRTVQPVRCYSPDGRRNIVLVDTPGFDDTHLSDVQVLKIIANWLKETYQNNIKLSGLLYFHRISDVRFSGTPLRNLSVFKDLCGDKNLRNVVLVTTMWDELEEEFVGVKREEDLLTDFWKDMIRLGSHSCRFQGTQESAWDILERSYLETDLQGLQIQEEMVDCGLQVHETTAAKTLLSFLVGGFKKFWGRVRAGSRGLSGSKKPFDGLRRRVFPGRSSISTHAFSESSSHVSSPTDSSSLFSHHPPSHAGSTSSGCSIDSCRLTLVSTITGLRLAYQVADMVAIPVLRGAIGAALHVAQLIEGMGGTHHAIGEVVGQSGWLLKEIAQYATQHNLPRDATKLLKYFKKELENVQSVVVKISSRGRIARFFLHDADVQAIIACTASMKAVYAHIEMKFAMNNAIARLEDQLEQIRRDTKLRQCQCTAVPHDELVNGEPSTVAGSQPVNV